ncbi:MAG: two-component system OmpR family sensor kinase [Motiliproteus sp.]|jgi:two-component system OmpR family sensor kinase
MPVSSLPPEPSPSLQKTLGLGLTLGVTLLWMVALGGAVLVSQSKLNELFDSALAETAQRIMPLAVVEILNREEPGLTQRIMLFEAHDEPLVYIVRDETGAILLQSHNAEPTLFNQDLLRGFSSSATHRFYGVWALQKTLHIEVAEPRSQRRAAIGEMVLTLLWPLVLLIPLCFLGTRTLVRYSLRPILAYRDEIESRGSGDLSPVRVQGLSTEILSIAEPVNRLLDRLRRALESERSFTANSAHELRTPIATALAQIQRLQAEASAGKIQDRALKVEASLRRLSDLSEKLMQLAKAEGGGLLSTEQHDLAPLLRLVIDELRHSAATAVIRLTLPENGGCISAIDPDAFAILVRNLLDNAIKHGAKDQPIAVELSSQGELIIVNAAAVIPGETLGQLRRRFVRSDTRAQGSGLGLAIADAIVTGIGATMTLNSPATGRADGFEVRVAFPLVIRY